jgi:GMP synthase (glutamine-hydrolysing)
MNMKLVEPLRELFKDEVRALGRELGLPDAFRRPPSLPGPGLAIRFPARSRTESSTSCARPTRSISRRSASAGLYDAIWQAFAVLLPVQQRRRDGRWRTYDYVCACAPSPRSTA